jgi:putative heme-binding domain-containing protein
MRRWLPLLIVMMGLLRSWHGGDPERGTGAQACGAASDEPPAPRVVIAWPSGPLEVRIAFNAPVDEAVATAAAGQTISYSREVRPADWADLLRPQHEVTPLPSGATRGTIRIAAARLDDHGQTLVLATDPHPVEGAYSGTVSAIKRPGTEGGGARAGLLYSLGGVEATWTEGDEAEPSWIGWWPHFDTNLVRALTHGSFEHQDGLQRMRREGRLTLRSYVTLPKGKPTLRLSAGTPIEEATLNGEPPETSDDGRQAAWTLATDGTPGELWVTLRTDEQPPALRVSVSREEDGTERHLPSGWLTLPWSPGPPPPETPPPAVPPGLAGGDPARGEAVFFSDEAKCSACHQLHGKGSTIGPDLSNLKQRDPASIFRDIADPSAVIHPDYQPYTVATHDGRVAVGVVRAEGADAIRVHDTSAQSTLIPRAEIADLQPSRTSIMPVGLAGALGDARLRDLIAFLASVPAPKE